MKVWAKGIVFSVIVAAAARGLITALVLPNGADTILGWTYGTSSGTLAP
jgi:hypothetical protein